jgi:hypothetical protein
MSKGKQHAASIEEAAVECMVCTSAFDASKRARVVCPFCEEGAPSACRECAQTYLLGSPADPHCMQCKHAWSLFFFVSTFPKAYTDATYRKNRQELAVEVERSRMVEAMPLVEARKGNIALDRQIKEMRREIGRLKRRMSELVREKNTLDNANRANEVTVRSEYLFHCPFGECRGLVRKVTYRCSLCERTVCPSCHGPRGDGHACKEEDRASAKAVMESTRPCPKCSTRIFRAHGCDIMFCMQCHTGFNWRTNALILGAVGNPHYYELQAQLKSGRVQPRVDPEVLCGGIVDWDVIGRHTSSLPQDQRAELVARLQSAHQLVTEVADYLQARLTQKDTIDIRVAYLEEEIDMSGLKRRLFLRKRVNDKNKEMRSILETFRTSVAERFRSLSERLAETSGRGQRRAAERLKAVQDTLAELDQILAFCNTAMRDALSTMRYTRTPQLEYGKRFLKVTTNVHGVVSNGRLITVPISGVAPPAEGEEAAGEVDEE